MGLGVFVDELDDLAWMPACLVIAVRPMCAQGERATAAGVIEGSAGVDWLREVKGTVLYALSALHPPKTVHQPRLSAVLHSQSDSGMAWRRGRVY
jgi:hypothetical protein